MIAIAIEMSSRTHDRDGLFYLSLCVATVIGEVEIAWVLEKFHPNSFSVLLYFEGFV
jgi:hypothetical protein